MTNARVWDEETGYTEIEIGTLAPGESVTVNLPSTYVDENLASTLDAYINLAVVVAQDPTGEEYEFGGTAAAPLNETGAERYPWGNEDGTEGDPEDIPGLAETPSHPGTPGGGEDPLGPAYGVNAGATIYKTTTSVPQNGEYYEAGETISYVITVRNIGEVTLDTLTVYDSLEGFASIGSATALEPDAESTFTYDYTVTEEDVSRGYVVNKAVVRYSYEDVNGIPMESNPVYSRAGENGYIPGEEIPDGITDGDPDSGWFDPTKMPGGDKPIIGPDGEPVIGPDGEPIYAPDGTDVILDPDGKPVIGPDGKPIYVPAETKPVTDPEGKPVTGPDGIPIYAPEGTTPVTDPDGIPVIVPTELPVTGPDGTPVTGPDGKPVVIPEGTPVLKLPDGTYGVILPGGTVIKTDENGNPILDEDGNLIYIGAPGMYGLNGLSGQPDCCKLQLESIADAEISYTMHACADHLEAAAAAETAAAAGTAEGWKQAADLWRTEIDELYQILVDAGDSIATAAVIRDRETFDAYLKNYEAMNASVDEVLVQKTIAELLRLRCAELCCMIHTAPDCLPDSLLNSYKPAENTEGVPGREFGTLNGSNASLRERYTAGGGKTLKAVRSMLSEAKSAKVRANTFTMAQAAWQSTLDRAVNAGYKATDKDGRKAIAACRKALDQVCAAHRAVLEILYADAPDVTEEAIASLYRNALLDAAASFGIK